VLFSSDEVANYINEAFEPAWESLRPALMVTIDFGNGQQVKRTLQGNVATYVCDSGGQVYDVLPGIYTPGDYLAQLKACNTLFESLAKASLDQVSARLKDHHTRQAAGLGATRPPQFMQAIALTGGGGKFGIENPTQRVLAGGTGWNGGGQFGFPTTSPNFAQASQSSGVSVTPVGGGLGGFAGSVPTVGGNQGQLANRPDLVLDAQVNERIRRKSIHERLAQLGPVQPNDIKKWLFKEVLHVDLDDPMLGLGKTLTENYPFVEEDRALERQDPKKSP